VTDLDDLDYEPCTHDCDENCAEDGCRHEHCWACGDCGCAGYCDDYQTYNLRPEETGGRDDLPDSALPAAADYIRDTAAQVFGEEVVVKVRLTGDADDIEAVAAVLDGYGTEGIEVIDRSGPRPNRHDPGVRVYLTVRIAEPKDASR
jgi:hypothetical protein